MADINVERKGPSIWPWVIGLLVLALLVWVLMEMFGEREDVTPVTQEEPVVVEPAPQEPVDGFAAMLPVGAIAGDPQRYAGRTVSGEAWVVEVVDENAFWVEDAGERLLVVRTGPPSATATPPQAGSAVTLRDARVAEGEPAAAEVVTLDESTREMVRGERAVLLVEPQNVQPSGDRSTTETPT